jgi:hypothetical protein
LVEEFFPAWWTAWRRKLEMHIENAPAHNSKKAQNLFGYNLPNRIPHPAYSHSISPSNFSLCGKRKYILIELDLSDKIDLLEAATDF